MTKRGAKLGRTTLLIAGFMLSMGFLSCGQRPRDAREITPVTFNTKEELPITASAYESIEPLVTETVSTTKLTQKYARRVFKDSEAKNWHEIIIGTEDEDQKVFAYFHFLPMETVKSAEADIKTFRWGLIMGKYLMLSGQLPNARPDKDLAAECKDAAPFFYDGLHSGRRDGVDIRGLHLSVAPSGKSLAVITITTTVTWEAIRRDLMNGQESELYALFPATARIRVRDGK